MVRSAHIEVTKTGRYFIEGHLGKDTSEVWIVCHGYGYLAEFLRRRGLLRYLSATQSPKVHRNAAPIALRKCAGNRRAAAHTDQGGARFLFAEM